MRTASLTVGATVVVGSFLVHPAGRDFRILDPGWLPMLLFLALPAVFVPLHVAAALTPAARMRVAWTGRVLLAALWLWALAGLLDAVRAVT